MKNLLTLQRYNLKKYGWITLAIVTIITFAVRYTLPVRDGDLWFHLLYGRYFLDHATLIADHTIFSWSPSTNDNIYCTWLPDIFLYLLHKWSGLPGLFIFRYLCMTTILVGVLMYARNLKIEGHPFTWLVCLISVVMSYTAAFIKPEIISFVLITLSAWNWWYIRLYDENSWKNCYLFPIIMLIWVNSHGAFVFGAVFYITVAAGELLNTWLSRENKLSKKVRTHLGIAFFLSFLSIFITPYGLDYPLQLFFNLLPTQDNLHQLNQVSAYTSTFTNANPYNFTLSANIAIFLLVIVFFRRFRKIEWSTLLANLVFAYLYTRFYRTTFFWAPIFAFSILSLYASGAPAHSLTKHTNVIKQYGYIAITILGFYLGISTIYQALVWPEKFLWTGFGITEGSPVSEAQYIKNHYPDAKIGNTYNQGAYLLWTLWPDNTVFFDARHFPYRKWSDEFFSFSAGKNIDAFTKEYPADLWCISIYYSKLLLGLLLKDEWKLAFYGKNSAVIVKKDIPLPDGNIRVAKDIYDFKNIYSATDAFRFAVHIGDFDVAHNMLSALKKRFSFNKKQKKHIKVLTKYLNGIEAYQEGHYETAIENFDFFNGSIKSISFLETNCYQYLTKQYWDNNEYKRALDTSFNALKLIPTDNPYALYNSGVISWYIEQNGLYEDEVYIGKITYKDLWKNNLKLFTENYAENSDFIPYVEIATKILRGNFPAVKPELIIPAEPTNRKLFETAPLPLENGKRLQS